MTFGDLKHHFAILWGIFIAMMQHTGLATESSTITLNQSYVERQTTRPILLYTSLTLRSAKRSISSTDDALGSLKTSFTKVSSLMSTMAEIRPSYSLQTLKTSPTVYKSLGENSSSPSKTTPGVSKASSSMTASNKHTDEEKLTSSLVKKLAALNATAKTIPSSNAVQSIIRIASTTAANSISFPVSTSVNTTNRPNHHGSGHIHEEGTGGIIFTYFLLVVLCVCAILFFAHIFLVLNDKRKHGKEEKK